MEVSPSARGRVFLTRSARRVTSQSALSAIQTKLTGPLKVEATHKG
jgi:hypothetical protein